MKTYPSGKGWFLWQIKRVAGGDPAAIAARARAQGVSWVSIKVNDGAIDYNKRPLLSIFGKALLYVDDILQPLVDALHAEGIQVFGWGYIYLNNPANEAKKSIERVKKFGLDGYMVDAEAEWRGKANEAKAYMGALRTGLPDTSIGMCSYRFPSVQWDFPWAEALREADYHCPQVYWAKSHNSAEQLARSVVELWLEKDVPVIPLGYAYQYEFDGSKPTQAEMAAFHSMALELGLPGEGWYEWGDAINADVEKFVAGLVWDASIPLPNPEPIPMPTPEPGRYSGNVLASATQGLKVRARPVNGSDVGKLRAGTSFEGDRAEIASDGKLWIHITAPMVGWVASWWVRYVDRLETPPAVEPVPAIPGPFNLLSDLDLGIAWEERFPDAKLDAYPATINMEETWIESGDRKFAKATLTYSASWLQRLKTKMTLKQWNWFWGDEAGIHNRPHGEIGPVQRVTTAHNKFWAESEDAYYYYMQCYTNDEPAPDLVKFLDPYRVHFVTVMHKTLNRATGGIFYPDQGKVPYPLLVATKTHTLRIEKQYCKSLVDLPLACNVKTGGGNLNVRNAPSTGDVVTSFPDGTPITIFELRKIGNGVWGRATAEGSVPGWVAMWFTDWSG